MDVHTNGDPTFSQQVLLPLCHGKFVLDFHDGKMTHLKKSIQATGSLLLL